MSKKKDYEDVEISCILKVHIYKGNKTEVKKEIIKEMVNVFTTCSSTFNFDIKGVKDLTFLNKSTQPHWWRLKQKKVGI
jgi:hypothetical protein